MTLLSAMRVPEARLNLQESLDLNHQPVPDRERFTRDKSDWRTRKTLSKPLKPLPALNP